MLHWLNRQYLRVNTDEAWEPSEWVLAAVFSVPGDEVREPPYQRVVVRGVAVRGRAARRHAPRARAAAAAAAARHRRRAVRRHLHRTALVVV